MVAAATLKIGRGGPGGMSAKVCITKEMVEKSELPTQQGDCRTTQQSRSGNTLKFAVACTNPPSNGEGQVTFNFLRRVFSGTRRQLAMRQSQHA